MAAAYSLDLRQRVIEAYTNEEGSMRQLSRRFKVSLNFVKRLIQRFRSEGSLLPKAHAGGRSALVDERGKEFLGELLEQAPDLTLRELCERFHAQFQRSLSISAMNETLRKMRITRKKKTFYDPQKETGRVQQRVVEYLTEVTQHKSEELIFIDETGAVLNMTPSYARCPEGERAYAPKPTAKGSRISMIGALTTTGLLSAFCFEGTLNGDVFLYYVEHFLLPHLTPGKVVILDNAAAHQDEEAIEMIEQTGATVLFLPPYCPELNPIEYSWSKIKNFLRKQVARTKEHLYQALSEALKIITIQDVHAYFKHCGLCVLHNQ